MIVDGHCDTLRKCYKQNISITNEKLQFNLYDAKTPMIQVLATYISPEEAENGFEMATKMIDKFHEQKSKLKDSIVQIYSGRDIEKVSEDSIGVILSTENGSVIQDDLSNIDKLYDKGVRMMSIVWNVSNNLASGALEENDTGLTLLGIEFIKKLNQKNILVDVSHSSYKTFWDTAKASTKPIVASHSCVYGLCSHPRNLHDDQLKQIAKMDGIVGIAFCNTFLNNSNKANATDIVRHITYIKDLVGIDYVGIGSDFDGLEEEHILPDVNGIRNINYLVQELKNASFSQREIDKVLGENWIRVLKNNI